MNIKLKPYSSSILAIGGILMVAMGIYFIFLRPPLLPEDIGYIHSTQSKIENNVPGLSVWLQKVFWVMGGFIFTSGLLIVFIALTSFRVRMKGAFVIVIISGITSIGFMTFINFIIDSNFKIVLLIFTIPWVSALILYRFHK